MADLCDFSEIISDTFVHVPTLAGGADFDLSDFDTFLRQSDKTAFLMYSVRNLTTSAEVFINGSDVGSITATSGNFWVTQVIVFGGTTLNDGNNEIAIKNVADATGFDIKDLICFFHQRS